MLFLILLIFLGVMGFGGLLTLGMITFIYIGIPVIIISLTVRLIK